MIIRWLCRVRRLGVEILGQIPGHPDCIFVPVGGGGLIVGTALTVKRESPTTWVIGVESDEAPSMHHALASGKRVRLEHIGIFVDGAAVRQLVFPF